MLMNTQVCTGTEDLLLVIDMQNVYTKGQEWACCSTETAAENIHRLLCQGLWKNAVFTQYLASPNPRGQWIQYNQINKKINEDPWLNAIVPRLLPWTKRCPLLTKSVYSSFSIPQVREAACKARRVIVTGVVAECCVLSTVLSAIDEGCPVIYLKDAVSGLTPRSEKETEEIVASFSPLHTAVATTEEYLSQGLRFFQTD
mgnify:FL=1